MKYFIDTANVEEIRQAAALGIIDGVTTNPSLIAKEGRVFEEVIKEITEIVDGPISAEVVSLEAEGMVKEALELVKIHPNVVIKVPMTAEGIKATSQLSKKGIKVNVTLVFSSTQALAAAKAGAAYVSPFVGRLDDIGLEGMELIEEIMFIFKNYGIKTEVIAASIRNRNHLAQAATAGSDIATIPFKVIMDSLKHPLTDQGIERFLKDWEGTKK
ncbi:fructose-6-phosphate aldolase [Proteiniclasticum sp. BAD-10]|jgi:transaldolase|uniref:Probable transaldolase n=1 Tax=Proteiniclasticum sediminis TaxID=2804028 RepID=A0A941HPA6_9CLOT|nr:fructose-6-phosphate aldolase [Proteiniclasticum sediminis]MBR0575129.1 fructose-6-phosphate aldolase [Proteiniclasticum sediminis]